MKKKRAPIVLTHAVESRILTIRGQKVILVSNLAAIYGVTTKRLNEQVKRNIKRFPSDFVFQLTVEEHAFLRSQIATLKPGTGRHRKFLPYAFTENGGIMAANVLNNPEAVRMSVFVVSAFIQMRELLSGSPELAAELKKIEATLTARLDVHETAIVDTPSHYGAARPAACSKNSGKIHGLPHHDQNPRLCSLQKSRTLTTDFHA